MGRRFKCQDCGATKVRKSNMGALPKRCADCAAEFHTSRCARWYAENRKKRRAWRAENKRRAKAWRERNQDHIRTYNETMRP